MEPKLAILLKYRINSYLLFLKEKRLFSIPILLIICIILLITIERFVLGYTEWADWTGFGPTNGLSVGKTLWDWMQLLFIPIFITFGAIYINTVEKKNELEKSKERHQDAIIQAYLDCMTTILLDPTHDIRSDEAGFHSRSVARARTVVALDQLDSTRKSTVIQFLMETGLIWDTSSNGPEISLDNANLSGIDLKYVILNGTYCNFADLEDATISLSDLRNIELTNAELARSSFYITDLSKSNLSDAHLNFARMTGSKLINANLINADFSNSFLLSTDFSDADLSGAIFIDADLTWAKFQNANLTGVNFTNARFHGTKYEGAILTDAIMPDGIRYNPDDHDEWLYAQSLKTSIE